MAAVSQSMLRLVAGHPSTLVRSLASRTDVQIMASIAHGDDRALGELYDRHGGISYALALRVVRDPSLAEDAVQEAFLSLWRAAASFDPSRAAPRSWLLTLVHRRAVDLVQSNQRHRRAEEGQPLEIVSSSAAETAELKAERSRVQAALAALPEKQRTALQLAYYGGYTQEQVAVRLGVPLGTVKSRLFHGLKRLGHLLAEPAAHQDHR